MVNPTWDFHPSRIYFGVAFRESAMWPHDGGGLLTEPDQLLPLLRDGLLATPPANRHG